jgi:ubiquinone/menaquinone biosynthesis C-methylase UbiE
MDFDAPKTGRSYSDRIANESWSHWCEQHLNPVGRDIVDIGCGGGIYSRAFVDLGAASVTGIDGSSQYINEARVAHAGAPKVSFVHGSASCSGLASACADVVFCRALIHHLSAGEQRDGALEMRRLLRPGGLCAVQDRTAEDVESSDPAYWIRSSLFTLFPHLLEYERGRRPQRQDYAGILATAGFTTVRVVSFVETRKRYASFAELETEIMTRKGKSILFELSDAELKIYCAYLKDHAKGRATEEVDPWTIWIAGN